MRSQSQVIQCEVAFSPNPQNPNLLKNSAILIRAGRRLPPSTDARATPCLKNLPQRRTPVQRTLRSLRHPPHLRPQHPPQLHRRKSDRRHGILHLDMSPGFSLRLQLHHELELELELANTARKLTGSVPSNPHKPVFPRVAASVPGQAVKADPAASSWGIPAPGRSGRHPASRDSPVPASQG